MSHRALIRIDAADKDRANAAAEQYFDPTGGDLTFTVGLSPTGDEPPTHYWASAQFDDAHWPILQQLLPAFPSALIVEYDLDTQPGRPQELLIEWGLQTIGSKNGP